MGNILKLELELPEFKEDLQVTVTLKKDGEVISTASSDPSVSVNINQPSVSQNPVWKQPAPSTTPNQGSGQRFGGNLMDINF